MNPFRRCITVICLACMACMAGCASTPVAHEQPPAWSEISAAVALLPDTYRPEVVRAMSIADVNAHQLIDAIGRTPDAQREGIAFLIANMPDRDLLALDADYLLENVQLAYQARERTPWGASIPNEVFLNNVLPYANVNERRDRWRRDFVDRFMPAVAEATSIEDAVAILNVRVFGDLHVRYHATKRAKPDQSVYESTGLGFASCTGLSILLTNALRAVGVPARLAGTPLWVNESGNHTWVEVWVDGQWRFIGAAEPGELDKTWFNGIASQALASGRMHAIYAVSFKRTDITFPLAWDETIDYVHAVNVTDRYTRR
jgi:hypothetical protein